MKLIFFLLFSLATSGPVPTFCDTICSDPTSVYCRVNCGCTGCFSTHTCDRFNKELKLMEITNTSDDYIKNIIKNINNVCDAYVQPDWVEYDETFDTNCADYKVKPCKNYCKRCDAQLMCSTIKTVLKPVITNYPNDSIIRQTAINMNDDNCTSDAVKLSYSFLIIILIIL
jgi:hypothetical protein